MTSEARRDRLTPRQRRGAEGELAARLPPMTAAAAGTVSQPDFLDLPIPLVSGGRAVLRVPIPLTGQDYDLLRSMLEAQLGGMKPAIVREAPAPLAGSAFVVDERSGDEAETSDED